MADYVIIGGGVYGCAVAWELAQQGVDVCLLEAKTIASGASGGLGRRGVRASGRDVRELPLMEEAYQIWPILHEQLDGFTGYEQPGQLLIFEQEEDRGPLDAQLWVQLQNGIESQMLSQTAVREREPHISEQIIGAIYTPEDGIADHTATTRSYASAAEKLGVDIREHTPAIQLERKNGRVTAVLTTQEERVDVKKGVLLVSNAHSQQFLLNELNIRLPLWPMYPQVMHTEPLEFQPVQHLIGHFRRVLAMKPSPKHQVMISGGWRGRLNQVTNRVEPVEAQVQGNLAEAVATYPCLAGVGIAEVSVERPELICQDGVPIIDTFAGAENMVLATGWCGHGWALAPAVAKHLAAWLLTGLRPERLRPFAYSRFFVT